MMQHRVTPGRQGESTGWAAPLVLIASKSLDTARPAQGRHIKHPVVFTLGIPEVVLD